MSWRLPWHPSPWLLHIFQHVRSHSGIPSGVKHTRSRIRLGESSIDILPRTTWWHLKLGQGHVMYADSHSSTVIKNISSITTSTSLWEMWDRIHRLNGNYMVFSISLFTSDGKFTSMDEQADILRKYFEQVSSSSHCTEAFFRRKRQAKRKRITVTGGMNHEPISKKACST